MIISLWIPLLSMGKKLFGKLPAFFVDDRKNIKIDIFQFPHFH